MLQSYHPGAQATGPGSPTRAVFHQELPNTRVETILEQLKTLGPQEFAHLTAQLRQSQVPEELRLTQAERQARLKELAGSLTDDEAEAMLAVIEREFEQVNEPAR